MEGRSGGSRVLELLLRKVKGIFILFCFPISLNACLSASSALHSFSEAFHGFHYTVLHSGLSLALSFSFLSINPPLLSSVFYDKAIWKHQLIW